MTIKQEEEMILSHVHHSFAKYLLKDGLLIVTGTTTDSSGRGRYFSSGMGFFEGPQTIQGKVGEEHDEGSPDLD